MKIKKVKFKRFLKLHLLKLRVYEHLSKKPNLIDLNLDKILVDIKKALQIIFHYHQANKNILFVGFPPRLELKLNLLTQHIAVPKSFNVQGILSNQNLKILKNEKKVFQVRSTFSSQLLVPKLMKKPDLVILFDHEKRDALLSEAWVMKVPVIVFSETNESNDLLNHSFYKVKGNFKNALAATDKNIFFMSLNFLFKNLKKKKVER